MEHLEEAISYYKHQGAPGDQTALVSLLKEIARDHGGSIPTYLVATVAEKLQTKETFLLAVIRRIPSLRLKEQHELALCAGPNCGKHVKLQEEAEKLAKASGAAFRLLPCQRQCGKGPNLRFDGKLYHKADLSLIQNLLESIKKGQQ